MTPSSAPASISSSVSRCQRFHGPDLEHGHVRPERLAALDLLDEAAVERRPVLDVELERGKAVDEARIVEQTLRARDRLQAVQRVLRAARAADAEPLETEQRLGHRPAVVQLSHQVVARHAHVVEEHLAELLVAGEVADRAQRDARRLQVHQQEADALLLLRLPLSVRASR